MNLIPIEVDTIHLGRPLPFALLTVDGTLLAPKGYVIEQRSELSGLMVDRGQLFIDITESEIHRRAYMGKLHHMVSHDSELGKIAEASVASADADAFRNKDNVNEASWLDLQEQAHLILRYPSTAGFVQRLAKLKLELDRHLVQNPDGTLFALNYLASTEVKRYSATHSMLVSCSCLLAARDVLKWPDQHLDALFNAALTMNIGMTELHDQLAMQFEALSSRQLRIVENHAEMSRDLLVSLGVSDETWLDAVLHHRATPPGPLGLRSDSERTARLIQRADMFAAKLAPRASRMPGSSASAMQSCYFDENRQLDEAGAALIKAVGIYSPGTFVKLTSNEIAIVVKRRLNTTMPKVAVLINRHGMPTGEPLMRETNQPDYRIVGNVPHRAIKVSLSLDRLLLLTKHTAADRLW